MERRKLNEQAVQLLDKTLLPSIRRLPSTSCKNGPSAFSNARGLGNIDWSPSESWEELLSMLAKFLKAGFEFHRSGSCALCLANVANGKMDAYWEVFVKPWDALAGYLLVKEAGGQTNDFESNLFENQGNLIIAASPELFGKILKLI